jgi:hypothetical protein
VDAVELLHWNIRLGMFRFQDNLWELNRIVSAWKLTNSLCIWELKIKWVENFCNINIQFGYVPLRPCYTVQFFFQLAMQFYPWEMLISEICEEFSICWELTSADCNEDSYLVILHISREELHCKLQEKLHRVTWPLVSFKKMPVCLGWVYSV